MTSCSLFAQENGQILYHEPLHPRAGVHARRRERDHDDRDHRLRELRVPEQQPTEVQRMECVRILRRIDRLGRA